MRFQTYLEFTTSQEALLTGKYTMIQDGNCRLEN